MDIYCYRNFVAEKLEFFFQKSLDFEFHHPRWNFKLPFRDQKGRLIRIQYQKCQSEIYHFWLSEQVQILMNSQSMNLKCKIPGCPAVAYAHIPKSSGLIKVKGTRCNGRRQVKARLENRPIKDLTCTLFKPPTSFEIFSYIKKKNI